LQSRRSHCSQHPALWALPALSPRRSQGAGSGNIAVRCTVHEPVTCGTKPTLDFAPWQTQHCLAHTANSALQRGLSHAKQAGAAVTVETCVGRGVDCPSMSEDLAQEELCPFILWIIEEFFRLVLFNYLSGVHENHSVGEPDQQ